MAYFTPEELPNNKYYIFGKEGAKNLAEDLQVPVLGEIPLVQSIREAGDYGRPAALQTATPLRNGFRRNCSKCCSRSSRTKRNVTTNRSN
jgi:ATP-binding protein involved in chromosome partitioning